MTIVLVMKVAVDQVIRVIAVGHGRVAGKKGLSFQSFMNCSRRDVNEEKPECSEEHGHANLRDFIEVSDDTLEKAARIFRALGDPTRLRLLTILSQGNACVSELASDDQLSTVSQRLRTLRNENLVTRKRQGKHIIYGLADDHVLEMIVNALNHAGERHF